MANEETTEETPKGEIQYADFSDMGGKELPDEVELPGDETQSVSIDYMEEPQEETVETETQEETSEINQKGEELTPEKESYWQHKYDTEAKALKEQNELLKQEIGEIKTQLNPPPKEEMLVEPVAPETDDPNDWVDYLKAKVVYDNKSHQKEMGEMKGVVSQFQTAMATQAQTEQANQVKVHQLGKLQTAGRLTPEEAVDCLKTFTNPKENEDEYFKELADYYKFKKGASTTPKTTAKKTYSPLATQAGAVDSQKRDGADEFFGDMGNYIKENY